MLQDIIGAKAALFSDKGQTILRGHENRNRRVVLLKGNLVQNSRSETRGINARVNLDGLFGFASIAEYTPEAAEKVIRAATDNALFLSRHTDKKIILPPSTGTGTVPLNRDIVSTWIPRLRESPRPSRGSSTPLPIQWSATGRTTSAASGAAAVR